MSDPVSVNSSNKPAKKNRPTGVDKDDYKNLEKWTNQKWAWEFLRRNEKFQEACRNVRNGSSAEQLAVAKHYGLRKFKDFTEVYFKKGLRSKPKFLNGSISTISNLDFESDRPLSRKVKIMPGKLLVLFDLASALKSDKFLDRQLEKAQLLLTMKLKQIRARLGKKADGVNPRHRAMGHYLRMLDARASGMSIIKSGEIISPFRVSLKEKKNRDDIGLRSQLSRKMKIAIEHTEVTYLYLAGMPSKTNVKKISSSA